jgi:hypothetical protein
METDAPDFFPAPWRAGVCPRCGATLGGRLDVCPSCGFVREPLSVDTAAADWAKALPMCPSCGQSVRAPAPPFPRYAQGYYSPLPWNADWDRVCEHCGLRFVVECESGGRIPAEERGVRRRATFRLSSGTYWQFPDLQLNLAGLEIEITTESHGGRPVRERCFLTREELGRLLIALRGPLAICFEQLDWFFDTT